MTPVARELLDRAGVDRAGEAVLSTLVTVPAGLDLEILVSAVRAVVDRHEVLRARLDPDGRQLIVPPGDEVDVRSWVRRVDAPLADRSVLVEEQARAAVSRLDPSAGVMTQVVWFDSGSGSSGLLLLVIAHLVVDTVSLRVLVPDLAEAYTTLAAGRDVALQPVPTTFRHWARALAEDANTTHRTAEL
ncbi:condensation domain-containing protein, partial [Plantactinospora solaniradicis]